MNMQTSSEDAIEIKNNIETLEKSIIGKNIKLYIYLGIKRLIDITGAIIGIALLIPTTILIYIVSIFLKENDGQLFYTQKRIGKNGKYFKLYKFRSMCKDADDKLAKYLAENEEMRKEFRETQKLQNDPRITKIGNFLRKTSIDELPQMINILKGDMSFIGPRPIVDGEIDKYENNKEKFLSVKPGLTGYWQVNGRSTTTYEERMKLELYYVNNQSLWLDVKIFFKTFVTVLKKEGAM